MNFNTEEISLCKEIAKYFRKPIGFGDWFYDEEIEHIGIHVYTMFLEEDVSGKIPLWTWQDARDWLREKGYVLDSLQTGRKAESVFVRFYILKLFKGKEIVIDGIGKTDLEAILKIVLNVLEEIK